VLLLLLLVAAFCPAVELSEFTKELRYCCQTCPYVYKITKQVRLAAAAPVQHTYLVSPC